MDNFGPFAGEGPTHSVPRGGASNRGGRGNNRVSEKRVSIEMIEHGLDF